VAALVDVEIVLGARVVVGGILVVAVFAAPPQAAITTRGRIAMAVSTRRTFTMLSRLRT
jgi:hypothetical protein